MYRHCIYCSADLGANETLEAFPVGRTVAFDAAKGRLWAVCRRCARWNLAPIEERWEAVEDAERRFTDTRLRVQRENIGLAKLGDGTRLVRVGNAVPGELAAWRYGDQFTRRRRRAVAVGAVSAAAGGAALALQFLGVLDLAWLSGSAGTVWWIAQELTTKVQQERPVHVLPAPEDGYGHTTVRRKHLGGVRLAPGSAGGIRLVLPVGPRREADEALLVDGPEAIRLLERIMVLRNRRGASRNQLTPALGRLCAAGSADRLIDLMARDRRSLGFAGKPQPDEEAAPYRIDGGGLAPPLAIPEALALEMALHEEQERRALEGELALLESAWREAEEIAGIADRLAVPAEAG